MPCKVGVFEKDGHRFPTIQLEIDGTKFGFTFGLEKAKLILANIEEIRAFVEKFKEV